MAKFITVWSSKGGVAKTTTALLLSAFYDSQNKKVLLYDADEQRSAFKTVTKSDQYQFDTTTDLESLDTSQYDYVISDIPPRLMLLSKRQRQTVRGSDVIVVPQSPGRLDYESVKSMDDELKNVPVIHLLTKVDGRSANDKRIASGFAKDWLKMGLLEVYKNVVNESVNLFSKNASKYSNVSRARKEVRAIAQLVEKKMRN
ncbi:MAG: hypothetical protein CL491_00910 [Acinetobacter sp.]|uniref:ParA family protein n=1 Tax=Acinetobacter sp. TaxID=472 RepID=UPI000C5573DF|nr:ParA family protein [Acinetobacter sp.]MBT48651.1 hypothetical protein [Acinetobacter sp.]|tara:strand:- start:4428 stop:5030 length:603 start_codon:yes stop_codon:yes gene_type:complete